MLQHIVGCNWQTMIRSIPTVGGICFLFFPMSVVSAEMDIDAAEKVLEEIQSRLSAQRKALRTWRGVAHFARYTREADDSITKSLKDRQIDLQFVVDAERESTQLRATIAGGRYVVERPDGTRVELKGKRIESRILTPAEYIEMHPYFETSQSGRRVTVSEDRPHQPKTPGEGWFDPNSFFSYDLRNSPLAMLEIFRKTIYRDEAGERKPPVVTKEGDLVHVKLTSNAFGGKHFNLYTFDLSKGGNLVGYAAESRGGEAFGRKLNSRHQVRIQYISVDDVFVPTEWSRWRSDLNSPEESPRGRVITIDIQAVNEPVDPTEFTVAGLGLRPGDKVVDEIRGIDYIYNEDLKRELPDLEIALAEVEPELPDTSSRVPATAPNQAAEESVVLDKKSSTPVSRPNRILFAVMSVAVVLLIWGIMRSMKAQRDAK